MGDNFFAPFPPKKSGFQVAGGLGGSKQKNTFRDAFNGQNNDKGVKPTIHPIGGGYTNTPEREGGGGYVAFSHISRPAWF